MSKDPVAALRQYLDAIQSVSSELGRLEAALNLWSDGDARAHAALLALRSVAAQFASVTRPQLHRGFVPLRQHWEQLRARHRIAIVTPVDEPLASWRLSPEAVRKAMEGCDQPWISIRKPTAELDVLLNCGMFCRQAASIINRGPNKLLQRLELQQEVIVKMPSLMWVPASRIMIRS